MKYSSSLLYVYLLVHRPDNIINFRFFQPHFFDRRCTGKVLDQLSGGDFVLAEAVNGAGFVDGDKLCLWMMDSCRVIEVDNEMEKEMLSTARTVSESCTINLDINPIGFLPSML